MLGSLGGTKCDVPLLTYSFGAVVTPHKTHTSVQALQIKGRARRGGSRKRWHMGEVRLSLMASGSRWLSQ